MVPQRFLSSLVLCLMLVGSSAVVSPAAAENYALLIGVSFYDEFNDLTNPVPDIRALGRELTAHGFLVEVLESPDRAGIMKTLRKNYLNRNYGPGDQLLIAFAGHGTYDKVTRIGYLAARDSARWTRDESFVSLLSYPWVLTLIDNIECPNILLVVDACYSGSLQSPNAGLCGPTDAQSTAKLRRFLTSGGVEYVPDGTPGSHTPFMSRLLDGLRSNKIGGELRLAQLQSHFMSQADPEPRWGSFGSDSGQGDFIFRRQERTKQDGPGKVIVDSTPSPSPSAPAAPKLRAEPKRVAENELKLTYQRKHLSDVTWNPDGDFGNEYRLQESNDNAAEFWEVVLDLESSLMWERSGSPYRRNRQEADEYVKELNRRRYAGHADWRLPTLEELASLVDPFPLDNLFISPEFDSSQESCWSADYDTGKESHPYFVSFSSGRTTLEYRGRTHFVRAVRTVQ